MFFPAHGQDWFTISVALVSNFAFVLLCNMHVAASKFANTGSWGLLWPTDFYFYFIFFKFCSMLYFDLVYILRFHAKLPISAFFWGKSKSQSKWLLLSYLATSIRAEILLLSLDGIMNAPVSYCFPKVNKLFFSYLTFYSVLIFLLMTHIIHCCCLTGLLVGIWVCGPWTAPSSVWSSDLHVGFADLGLGCSLVHLS